MTSEQALDVARAATSIATATPIRETPSAGSLARPSPSRRMIPDATQSSENWSPPASMRSSSDAAILPSARSVCIFPRAGFVVAPA